MTSGQKIAVSFFISILLFSACAVASFAGLFSVIETRYYQPLIERNISEKITQISDLEKEYFSVLENRFVSFVTDDDVKSYVNQKPTESQIKSREKKRGKLFSETFGLKGIRIIDKNGRQIHYSTFQGDILKKTKDSLTYKNVKDAAISIPEGKISSDSSKAQFAFKYDLNVNEKAVCDIIFYFNLSEFSQYLSSKKVVPLSDSGFLCDGNIIIYSMPSVGEKIICDAAKEKLSEYERSSENETGVKIEKLVSLGEISQQNLLIAYKKCFNGIIIAQIIEDQLLQFPLFVRVLLLVLLGTTIFLICFFIFSLRRDDMAVINERIRKFQLTFVSEYVSKMEKGENLALPSQIAARKEELNKKIVSELGKRGKKHKDEINELLDKSWEEIFAALGVKKIDGISSVAASKEELRELLKEVISTSNFTVNASSVVEKVKVVEKPVAVPSKKAEEPADEEKNQEISEIEELSELDEAEVLEEAEEIEEAEAVEDLEEAEEIEEAEAVEDLEEAEEIEEAEAFEDLEEVEEIEDAESAEDLEEAVALDEPEYVDVPETLDEIEEVESLDAPQSEDEIPDELDEEPVSVDDFESIDEEEEIEPISPLDPMSDNPDDDFDKFDLIAGIDETEFSGEKEIDILREFGENSVFSEFDEALSEEPLEFGEPLKNLPHTEDDLKVTQQFKIYEMDYSSLDDEKTEKFSPIPEIKVQEVTEGFFDEIKASDFEEPAEKEEISDLDEAETLEEVEENSAETSLNSDSPELETETIVEISEPADTEPENVESADIIDSEPVSEIPKIPEISETERESVEDALNELDSIPEAVFVSSRVPYGFTNWAQSGYSIFEKMQNSVSGKKEDPVEIRKRQVFSQDSDGVVSIKENLPLTDIVLDPDFKSLVDSILKH